MLKLVSFKRAIRIFFKYTVVADHIEGLRHPPICLFETIFRVNVSLTIKSVDKYCMSSFYSLHILHKTVEIGRQ
jgi:hypothetical protein